MKQELVSKEKLPVNWKVEPLEEVVFFQEGPGVRKYQYTTSGVKLINVGNLHNGNLILERTNTYISKEEAYGKYKHFLIDDGDLLIASSGLLPENFHNKIAFARKEHLPLCMNTSTIRFKTKNPNILNIRYFSYFLKSNLFKKQVSREIVGGIILNFGPSHLKRMKVLVPPLDIQQQIFEKLDAQMVQIEIMKKEALKEKKASEEILKSHLSFLFNELNIKKKDKTFGEITINYDGKRIPVKSADRINKEKIYPYYGASGIIDYIDNYLFDGEFLLIGEDGENLRSRVKPIAFLAKGKFWVNNHAHIIDTKPEILKEYLMSYINLIDLKPWVDGAAQPKLTQTKMNSIPIPLVNLEKQKEIVKAIKQIEEEVEFLQKNILQKQYAISLLTTALLNEVFEGYEISEAK